MHISGGIVAQEPTPIGGVGNRPDGGPAYQGHQMTSMQTRDRRRCHEELSRRNSAPPAGGEHRGVSLAAAPESARAARDFTTPALRGWRPEPLIPDAVAPPMVRRQGMTTFRAGQAMSARGGEAAGQTRGADAPCRRRCRDAAGSPHAPQRGERPCKRWQVIMRKTSSMRPRQDGA